MSVFNNYARYYNLLYGDKNYQEEVDYVEKLIKIYSGNSVSSILDLGCGTGRHDILLAEKGYKITGVDMSEKMIEIARDQNIKSIELIVGDVRKLNLNKQFDAAISLFHVASYQTKNEDFENYIKTAYNHLKKGGIFIFDFWYGPAVLNDKPVIRIKRLENESMKLTRISEPVIHENENIVDVNFEIIIESKRNNKTERFNELHKMRYWFKPEMEFLIKNTGFGLIDSFKWLSIGEKLGFDSWNGVIVLQKLNLNNSL
jgi:SAM-dependent methyltransferase